MALTQKCLVLAGIALVWIAENMMEIPLVSKQERIFSEGIVEPGTVCDSFPAELQPTTGFTTDQIRRGLPKPDGFKCAELRFCARV